MKEVRVAALSEPDEGLRRAVAERFAIEAATADYHDLLADDSLDAMVICLPRRCQSLVVADALSTRRAVLSDKPVALTLDDAAGLVATARASGALWMVGYMKRHDPGVRRFARLLSDLVSGGRLGGVLDVSMRDCCASYGVPAPEHVLRAGPRLVRYPEAPLAPDHVPGEWRADYEYTINVASHDINLLRMLFGDPLAPTAFCFRRGGAQHALFHAGQVPINLVVAPADLGRWDQRIDVTFSRGRVSLVLPSPLARDECAVICLEGGGAVEQLNVPAAERIWAFEAQARAFIEAVVTGAEPDTSGAASLADIEMIDSLWRRAECR
jgi:predicted dehydrogenase